MSISVRHCKNKQNKLIHHWLLFFHVAEYKTEVVVKNTHFLQLVQDQKCCMPSGKILNIIIINPNPSLTYKCFTPTLVMPLL